MKCQFKNAINACMTHWASSPAAIMTCQIISPLKSGYYFAWLGPSQVNNLSLCSSVELPAPNLNFLCQVKHNLLTNKVMRKHTLYQANESITCQACLCQMRFALSHKCQVHSDKCLCNLCTHFEHRDCVSVSNCLLPFIFREQFKLINNPVDYNHLSQ